MKALILGVTVKQSKRGTTGSTIYYSCPASNYERNTAIFCSGTVCRSEYTSGDYSDLKIGGEVELEYEPGYQNAAVLTAIIPL